MLELALRSSGKPVLLKDIGKSQGISKGYLEHIARMLRTAGLIVSSRGARGGYMLARDPEDINLREIVQAVEGPLNLVECVSSSSVCDKVQNCVTREVWQKLSNSLKDTLSSVTLRDMLKIEDNKKKTG